MADKRLEYPLQQVLGVKYKRVEEAERFLKEKKEELEREEQRLVKVKEERDKVEKHRLEKLDQMREAMDGGETTTEKIQQMKVYLEVVKEKVAIEDQKVKKQEEQVKLAEDKVKEAEEELRIKRNEVDKLEQHKVEWTKEMKKEIELEELKEQDELGSAMFLARRNKQ